MESNKKEGGIVQLVVVLGLITFICALLLGVINGVTADKIAQNAVETRDAAMAEIIPDAEFEDMNTALSADEVAAAGVTLPAGRTAAQIDGVYKATKDGEEVGYCVQVEPKGFGSENKGGIKMLVPADGLEGVKKAVMEIILHASMNPCPPMVVGIGIGGTMDRAAVMSKIALTRSIDSHNPMPEYAKLEDDLLELINETGIGPQLGGTTSCLGVNIEWGPTHIAGLPVAVTICCHACRHAKRVL